MLHNLVALALFAIGLGLVTSMLTSDHTLN